MAARNDSEIQHRNELTEHFFTRRECVGRCHCAPWVHSGVEDLKRFTDTQKWDDPWFWELSPTAKLLWLFLLDHCDNAGAVEFNSKIASFKVGAPIEPKHLAELGDRLKTLKTGKLWITKFIRFQFGSLEPTNNPHRSILKLLSFHGLKYPEDVEIARGCQGAAKGSGKDSKTRSGQGKDQDRIGTEGVQGEIEPKWESAKLWLADWKKNGATYTEAEARGAFLALQANGWMWGRNPVTDPRAALERQIQTDRERNHGKHRQNSGERHQPPPAVKGSSPVGGF